MKLRISRRNDIKSDVENFQSHVYINNHSWDWINVGTLLCECVVDLSNLLCTSIRAEIEAPATVSLFSILLYVYLHNISAWKWFSGRHT